MMTKWRLLSAAFVAVVFVAALAIPAATQDLDSMENEAWLQLNGTVTSVSANEFKLDYGTGIVRVEMDDWDDTAEGYYVSPGDDVTVLGKLDADVAETRSIEAASVYVDDLNTYFYVNPADEEDVATAGTRFDRRVIGMNSHAAEVYPTTVVGTVKDVDGREFTIDVGTTKLIVDTSQMSYNPLDVEGYQQVEAGDRVRVIGKINSDLSEIFQGRKLAASSVTTLTPAHR